MEEYHCISDSVIVNYAHSIFDNLLHSALLICALQSVLLHFINCEEVAIFVL